VAIDVCKAPVGKAYASSSEALFFVRAPCRGRTAAASCFVFVRVCRIHKRMKSMVSKKTVKPKSKSAAFLPSQKAVARGKTAGSGSGSVSGSRASKQIAKKVTAKRPIATKSTSANTRSAALEATGLAERVLEGRNVNADIGVEMVGKVLFAVIRVRVEDLPMLLG
jgi:hypothetical protein